MSTTFYPFPFPVLTPLGEAYCLYVTTAPLWENDVHLCVLDDGRMLHFTSNQLKYVGNGSYDIKKPRPLQTEAPTDGGARPAEQPVKPSDAGGPGLPVPGTPREVFAPCDRECAHPQCREARDAALDTCLACCAPR